MARVGPATQTSSTPLQTPGRLRRELHAVFESFHPKYADPEKTSAESPSPRSSQGLTPAKTRLVGPTVSRIVLLVVIAVSAYLPNFFTEPFTPLPLMSRTRLASLAIAPDEMLPWPTALHWQSATPPPMLRKLMEAEEWFGADEWVHRAVGLSLHLGCALLLWWVLAQLNVPGAWLAAMLFAIHPGNLGAVARVDQHGRLWAAGFTLAAILLLLKSLPITLTETADDPAANRSRRPQWEADWVNPGKVRRRRIRFSLYVVLAFLFAWAGALCQPATALLVAPVVAALALWQHRSLGRSKWKTTAVLAPFMVFAIFAVIGGWNTEMVWVGSSFLKSINTSAWVRVVWAIGWATRWALMPYPPSGQIGFVRSAVGPTTMAFGVAAVAVMVLAAVLRRRIGAALLVALFCFMVSVPTVFAPLAAFRSSSSVSGGGDGDTYLLAMPLIALVVALLLRCVRRLPTVSAQLTVQLAGGIAAIVILGLATAAEAQYFASPEHVLEGELAAHPMLDSHGQEIRARFARLLIGQGKYSKAAQVLGGLKPQDCTDASLATVEGDLLLINEKPGAGIVWLQRAATLDPNNAEVSTRIAEVEIQLGRMNEAADTYKQAIQTHPGNADLMNGYARYLAKIGKTDAAMEQLHAAILAQPDYAPPHVTMGLILMDEQKFADATTQFLAACKLDPQNFDAEHDYGILLLHDHKADDAVRYLSIAAALRPGSPEAHNDLGVALSYSAKLKRAITEFQRAIALQPTYAPAIKNLKAAVRKEEEEGSGF